MSKNKGKEISFEKQNTQNEKIIRAVQFVDDP